MNRFNFKILKTLHFQVLVVLLLIILFGDFLPKIIQQIIYTLSLIFKSLLLLTLPLLIFNSLILSFSIIKSKKAFILIFSLLLVVLISNYISTLVAYLVSSLDIISINIASSIVDNKNHLKSLWEIAIPELIPMNYMLVIGLISGLLLPLFPDTVFSRLIAISKNFNSIFLEKFFIPILPVFVAGFILQLQYDGILIQCIKYCLPLMILIIITYVAYLIFLFLIVSKFNLSICKTYIKNSLPAAFIGFATMSSLAAMPLTIDAAEKNTNYSPIGRIVVVATVNIHMIGLAINIPLMALSILSGFGHSFPSFLVYSVFAFYFVLAQFAAAGAPGCGILLMIPLLEKYLGFTNEMSGLITIIYILFDAAETGANILGNSVLSIAISKLSKIFNLIR